MRKVVYRRVCKVYPSVPSPMEPQWILPTPMTGVLRGINGDLCLQNVGIGIMVCAEVVEIPLDAILFELVRQDRVPSAIGTVVIDIQRSYRCVVAQEHRLQFIHG